MLCRPRAFVTRVTSQLRSSPQVPRGDVQARLPLYFGQDGATLVLLLVGGSNGTQAKDIRRAQQYWRDYLGEK